MKIAALNASFRGERGYTGFLLARLAEGAVAAGAAFETIDLSRRRVNRCTGCSACQTATRRGRCVHDGKDDAAAIFATLREADLHLFATPIYVFALSSLLKTLLERLYGLGDSSAHLVTRGGLLFHEVDRPLCKPFATLITCDNLEAATPANALHYFETYSRFMDAPRVGSLVRNAGTLAGHGRDATAVSRFPALRDVHAAFVEAGGELARDGRIRTSTRRRASREIIPVPLFGWLKRLPFFKGAMLEGARRFGRAATKHDDAPSSGGPPT